jgi:hypothetical protein
MDEEIVYIYLVGESKTLNQRELDSLLINSVCKEYGTRKVKSIECYLA